MDDFTINITEIIADLAAGSGKRYNELYALLDESEQALDEAAWNYEPAQFRIYYNRQSDTFYNELYRDAIFAEFLPDDAEQLLKRDTWTYNVKELNILHRTIRIERDIDEILNTLLDKYV